MAKKKIQNKHNPVVVTNKKKTWSHEEKEDLSKEVKKNNDEGQKIVINAMIIQSGEEHQVVTKEDKVVTEGDQRVPSNKKKIDFEANQETDTKEKISNDKEVVTNGKKIKKSRKRNISDSSRRAKDALYKRMKRMDPEYREKERLKNRERKKLHAERIRNDPVLLATFREKDRRRKSSARQNDTQNNLIEHKNVFKEEIERERNRLRKAQRRMDPNYRMQERERDRLRRSAKRQNLQYRAHEQQINTIQRKRRRHMKSTKANPLNPELKQENNKEQNNDEENLSNIHASADDSFVESLLANVETVLNIPVEESPKIFIKEND